MAAPTQPTTKKLKVISTINNLGTGTLSKAKKALKGRAEQLRKQEAKAMGN